MINPVPYNRMSPILLQIHTQLKSIVKPELDKAFVLKDLPHKQTQRFFRWRYALHSWIRAVIALICLLVGSTLDSVHQAQGISINPQSAHTSTKTNLLAAQPIVNSTSTTDYVVFEGRLRAVNRQTGKLLWSFPDDTIPIDPKAQGPAIVASHSVLIAVDDGLYALDIQSGAIRWSFNEPGPFGSGGMHSFVLVQGVVYCTATAGGVYAVSAETGREIWSFRIEEGNATPPTVVNGIVYAESRVFDMFALDAKTGKEIWRYAGEEEVFSAPAVENGVVYVGSADHTIRALEEHTGKELWRLPLADEVYTTLIVKHGVLYVGLKNQQVYALDAETGAPHWTHSSEIDIADTLNETNGVIYVHNAQSIAALDEQTGKELWQATNLTASYAARSHTIHIAATTTLRVYVTIKHTKATSSLYALDTKTGKKLWEQSTDTVAEMAGIVSPLTVTLGPDGNPWFLVYPNKIATMNAQGTVTTHTVPNLLHNNVGFTSNDHIITGADGSIWFTESTYAKIYRLTAAGKITEFSIPRKPCSIDLFGCEQLEIFSGPSGNVWFLEGGTQRLGQITTRGIVTVSSLYLTLADIPTVGPNGDLWFINALGPRLERIDARYHMTEIPLPKQIVDDRRYIPVLTVDRNGVVWYADVYGNLWKYTSDRTVQVLHPAKEDVVSISTLTSDTAHNLWYFYSDGHGKATENGNIIRFSLDTGQITRFSLPQKVTFGSPFVIDKTGAVWFQTGKSMIRMTADGQNTEFSSAL